MFGNLFPNLYQGGIGFNLGYEFRHSRQKQFPIQSKPQAISSALTPRKPSRFHQEVNSYFGELQVPLSLRR